MGDGSDRAASRVLVRLGGCGVMGHRIESGGDPTLSIAGGYRSHLPAYASTVTFRTIEEYLDVADQCLALGFRAIKLHAFGEVARDGALAVVLRRHVGDEIALMYDGSAAFDLQDAIRLGGILRDQGFEWYEEPMREFS